MRWICIDFAAWANQLTRVLHVGEANEGGRRMKQGDLDLGKYGCYYSGLLQRAAILLSSVS